MAGNRGFAALLWALVLAGGLVFGLAVADPLGALQIAGESSLRADGGRVEYFRGPGGELLRTWVVGPLSAGPPVVLLHGLGASSEYWAGTARALARSGRTLVIPDAPGSGRSEPPRAEGWGLPGRVLALRSLVRSLGLSSFDLVGHSLGGWTAARFALEEPHGIRRLVLVDPGGFSLPPGDDEAAFRRTLRPESRVEGRTLLDLLFFRKPFPGVGFVADAVARNYSSPGVTATVASLGRTDGLVGREAELPEGTVLIWGERDGLFPAEDGRLAASRARRARFLLIEGAGHDGPLETPGPFAAALTAALEGRPVHSAP